MAIFLQESLWIFSVSHLDFIPPFSISPAETHSLTLLSCFIIILTLHLANEPEATMNKLLFASLKGHSHSKTKYPKAILTVKISLEGRWPDT